MKPLLRRFRPPDARCRATNEANRRWARLVQQDPGHEWALFQIGSNLLRAGQTGKVEVVLRTLAGLPGPVPHLRRLKLQARLANRQARHEEAEQHWDQFVRIGGNADKANLAIARSLYVRGAWSGALKRLDLLSDQSQSHEATRLLRARICARLNRWNDVREAIGDIDQYHDLRVEATELLFQSLVRDGRLDSARRLFEADDRSPPAHLLYLKGKLEFTEKSYARALEDFRRCTELDEHAEGRVWLVRTLQAINRVDDARREAELVAATANWDATTRARCWEAAGLLGDAAREYRVAADTSRDPAAWLRLVRFHHGYRDWHAALFALQDAARRGVRSPELAELDNAIRQGFVAVGQPVPTRFSQRRGFLFRSSERMVEAIVNQLRHEAGVAIVKNGAGLASPGTAGQRPPPAQAGHSRKGHRIVLVINSLGPGGAERQVVNLANALVNTNPHDEVFLLCTHLSRTDQDCFYLDQLDQRVRVSEYYQREIVLDPNETLPINRYARWLSHVQPVSRQQKILQLAEAVAELQPDVLHGWLDETFINVALVGRMLGVPRIVGRWGSMPPGVARTVSEKDQNNIDYLETAYRQIARLPGLTLSSNSRLTADAYAQLMGVPAGSIHIAYNGIDEQRLAVQGDAAPGWRASLGIAPGARVIGTVLRMTEEKRPLLWVEAAADMATRHPGWHFVIVGAGPMECEIRDHAVRLGLTNLHLPGKQKEIGGWFVLFDVMLLTSRVEGVSNAVVESQFCGCPVVAPDVGGLSEAMADGVSGVLLQAHEAHCFADAVEWILSDEARHRSLQTSARQFARERFAISSMVSHYRKIFGTPAAPDVPSARKSRRAA